MIHRIPHRENKSEFYKEECPLHHIVTLYNHGLLKLLHSHVYKYGYDTLKDKPSFKEIFITQMIKDCFFFL